MVIARIRGGLGNQLFQYSAARALAWKNGVPLKLDLYTYSKQKTRKFELNQFQIDAQEATREEVHQFTGSNPIIRFLNKRENYLRCPQVFSQPHYHFVEDFFSLRIPVYLAGYWNSEKYFIAHRDQLLKQFTPVSSLSPSYDFWRSQMHGESSVAIHVRRGDYVANQKFNSFFGTVPIGYYRKAIDEIKHRINDPSFFVFSDDIAWCKSNLNFIEQVEFVSHDISVSPIEDLLLMSQCKHQIIANSTYSWWGAWLNQNPDKLVIAPSQWFVNTFTDAKLPPYASRYYNTKDLLPANWIKL